MDLRRLLEDFREGKFDLEATLAKLKLLPYEELGFAKVDHHRASRQGFPEVIYCEGKTPAQVAAVAARLASQNKNLLATRASREIYQAVAEVIPEAAYHPAARAIALVREKPLPKGKVLVLTAGTADIPVAEEAALSATTMGLEVEKVYDVGVAGLHRLFACREKMEEAQVIIVVAGMEGALASVVAGLTPKPVIAVPTSIGYGASLGGLAALLTMLNSCSPGVAVVNIDNGFGAAAFAHAVVNIKS